MIQDEFFREHEIPIDLMQVFKRAPIKIDPKEFDIYTFYKPLLINETQSLTKVVSSPDEYEKQLIADARNISTKLQTNLSQFMNLATDATHILLNVNSDQDQQIFRSLNTAYLQADITENDQRILRSTDFENIFDSIPDESSNS